MRILAIDTALGACSVCVIAHDVAEPLGLAQIALERGHAEALMPLLERVMTTVDGGFSSLARVAVTVGPGSFTGLRVGVSAARAIGLAAGIPVVGVSTLAALCAPMLGRESGRLAAAAIDARHGFVYFQALSPKGGPVASPRHCSIKDAVRMIGAGPVSLAGSGATLVAQECWAIGLDAVVVDAAPGPDIRWVARLGLLADPANARARPLYLKEADARPQDNGRLERR
jgi:tRNA threonylcarbamoyl adenosine modification protein YeaZ